MITIVSCLAGAYLSILHTIHNARYWIFRHVLAKKKMSTYVSTYILWHVAPTIMIIVEAVLEDVTGLWPQPYILMCLLCELPLCVSPQWSIRSVISRSSRDFLCSDSNHKTDVNLLSGMGNQRMKDLDLYPFPTFNTFSEKVAQGVFLGHISAMHWLCVTVFQFVYFRQHLFFDTCHTSIVGICSCGCAGVDRETTRVS